MYKIYFNENPNAYYCPELKHIGQTINNRCKNMKEDESLTFKVKRISYVTGIKELEDD